MKAIEIIEKIEGHRRAVDELLLELKAMATGAETRSQLAQKLLKTYVALWKRRYGVALVGSGVKDVVALKRLLPALPVEEVERRMVKFLSSDDPFYSRARHPIAMFCSAINKLAPESTQSGSDLLGDLDDEAPMGCDHKPPCKSDAQHTSRALKERRRR